MTLKMSKKWLSFALAIIMGLTLLPGSVSAAETGVVYDFSIAPISGYTVSEGKYYFQDGGEFSVVVTLPPGTMGETGGFTLDYDNTKMEILEDKNEIAATNQLANVTAAVSFDFQSKANLVKFNWQNNVNPDVNGGQVAKFTIRIKDGAATGTAQGLKLNFESVLVIAWDDVNGDYVTVNTVRSGGITSAYAQAPATSTPVMKFDWNQDGFVDANDISMMVNIANEVVTAGNSNESALWLLLFDANGDGYVDAYDINVAVLISFEISDPYDVEVSNDLLQYLPSANNV